MMKEFGGRGWEHRETGLTEVRKGRAYLIARKRVGSLDLGRVVHEAAVRLYFKISDAAKENGS